MAQAKKTEVQKTEAGPVIPVAKVPEDLARDHGRGTEGIGKDDVRPPRIILCQAKTLQRIPDDSKNIPGLQELDMFNDLSNEIYGRGPLKFVVLQYLGKRDIEFFPMDAGGGVKDFNVPPDDPRTKFTTDQEGNRVKPAATRFFDYLVWLTENTELAVLSMKSTQIKVAIKLNGLLKLPLKLDGTVLADPPAWARTYSVSTKMEHSGQMSWGGFNLKIEGITPLEIREQCAVLSDVYGKRNIVVEHEQENDFSDPDAADAEKEPIDGGM